MIAGRVQRIGDDLASLRVDRPERARALASALRADDRFLEAVAGLDSVVVQFDPLQLSFDAAVAALESAQAYAPPMIGTESQELTLSVRYGGDSGPDLQAVCTQLALTETEFVERHCACVHRVEMIGFTPGFAYCGGLDRRLSMPRLKQPRARLPAGSVGISATQTGLYALPGPGGWPIVGRTDAPLFDATRDEPFLLKPGVGIRFVPA